MNVVLVLNYFIMLIDHFESLVFIVSAHNTQLKLLIKFFYFRRILRVMNKTNITETNPLVIFLIRNSFIYFFKTWECISAYISIYSQNSKCLIM